MKGEVKKSPTFSERLENIHSPNRPTYKTNIRRQPSGQSIQTQAFTTGSSMGKADIDYGVGDTVSHIKFGTGVVKSVVDGGRDYEVTVEFENYGVKKMFASFAKLKKI